MEYTVDYFINKFEAIPEDKWCVYRQTDDEFRHCAIGWCNSKAYEIGGVVDELPKIGSEGDVLMDILDCNVAQINNGLDRRYQQLSAKQRILAALNDVKNACLR